MKILLIHPPHTAIGSRLAGEHLPPLGLLCVGGPLVDAGHEVKLLDADRVNLSCPDIIRQVQAEQPDLVLLGHSGSSSVHVTVAELCRLIKKAVPAVRIVYGGVYPSYHWDAVLQESPEIDYIVRGEGERTTSLLAQALEQGRPCCEIRGIAYRLDGKIAATPAAKPITNLDAYRVGWELIDHRDYSYWGGKRAVVVQFSRGCPHQCIYCGQRGFWTKWRCHDPVRFAGELARLYREHGVELINFADELPTGSQQAWRRFLEALIAEQVPLTLVASTRAGDIVRDRDTLHLYKKAGLIRFLLGIESYDEKTLRLIRKGAQPSVDQQAIALLRRHGIISMATLVVGFKEETDRTCLTTLRSLLQYDPDQINLIYATPHRWTPFYSTVEERRVVQSDTRLWDYKHQVLATAGMPAWRVFAWSKAIEVLMQIRPKSIFRLVLHPDAAFRHAMRWYTKIGRRVWFHEIAEFLFRLRPAHKGPTLKEFLGASLAHREYVLAKELREDDSLRQVAGFLEKQAQ